MKKPKKTTLNIDTIDTSKVKIDSENSLIHWCAYFNCSKDNLIKTVLQVGDSIISVDAFLEMNHYKNSF